MTMTTAKQQLIEVMGTKGEQATDLVACFYQPMDDYSSWRGPTEPIKQCTIDELPNFEFDDGFGGTEGPYVIAFTTHYVYIKVQYDGAEWMEAIPRNPEDVTQPIPFPGG